MNLDAQFHFPPVRSPALSTAFSPKAAISSSRTDPSAAATGDEKLKISKYPGNNPRGLGQDHDEGRCQPAASTFS
jgi:hypothetical protein